MRGRFGLFAVGLVLLAAPAARAQVTGGILHVDNTHMDWWGGVARDATARLYDVDDLSVKLDQKAGTITFRAKKGKRVDLDRLHESIWATRLGDGTGMDLYRMYVTAEGEVSAEGNDVVLKLPGTREHFVLGEESGKGETFRRLREAVGRGEKVVAVTGRLDGWNGNFTKFLSKLPDKPRRILVTEFQTAKR